jgi:hypothetical protein
VQFEVIEAGGPHPPIRRKPLRALDEIYVLPTGIACDPTTAPQAVQDGRTFLDSLDSSERDRPGPRSVCCRTRTADHQGV